MTCASPTLSTNGTLKDVAAFVGVGVRTLCRWNVERPPRIAFYCDGGANVYLEADVVGYVAKHYVADHRMAAGEILELVRRQWREHLQLRAGDMRAAQTAPESPTSPARPSLCAAPGSASRILRPDGVCIVCGSSLILQFWRGHYDNKRVHCNHCGSEVTLRIHHEKQPNRKVSDAPSPNIRID